MMDEVVCSMEAYDYHAYEAEDVRAALMHENCSVEDFKALLSPAALPFLEQMAQRARQERHAGILEILSICLHLCIFQIIVKITAYTAVLTATITYDAQNWMLRVLKKEMQAIARTGLEEIPDP